MVKHLPQAHFWCFSWWQQLLPGCCPPATSEIWHFAFWLQPVSCCPCWALPITSCLPGCLALAWGCCLGAIPLSPTQHSSPVLQAGQAALLCLCCCSSKGSEQMEPGRKGQTTRQGSSSAAGSQSLGLWPIKTLVIVDWGWLSKQAARNVTKSTRTRNEREQKTGNSLERQW